MAEGLTQEELTNIVKAQTNAVMAERMQNLVEVIAKPYEDRLTSIFAIMEEIADIALTLPEDAPQRTLIGVALLKLKKKN